MQKKLITILLTASISSLFFSTTVYANENEPALTTEESVESVEPEENIEPSDEETEIEETEDIEDIEETEDMKDTEENTDTETTDNIQEIESSNDTEDNSETNQSVEVVEKTHEYLCVINITYQKEYCEAYYEGAKTTLIELTSTFEVPKEASYSEFFDDVSESSIKTIIEKAKLPETAEKGFDIKATIDTKGNVTIQDIIETSPKEVVTECLVQYNAEDIDDTYSTDIDLDDIITQLNSMSEEELESALSAINITSTSEN